MTQQDKNAYILFYKKTNVQLSASTRYAAPVAMNENDDKQVGEGQVIAASRAYMDPDQFAKATQIERAPTHFLRDEKHKHKMAESRIEHY